MHERCNHLSLVVRQDRQKWLDLAMSDDNPDRSAIFHYARTQDPSKAIGLLTDLWNRGEQDALLDLSANHNKTYISGEDSEGHVKALGAKLAYLLIQEAMVDGYPNQRGPGADAMTRRVNNELETLLTNTSEFKHKIMQSI